MSLTLVVFLLSFAIHTQGYVYSRGCIGAHLEYRRCGSACPVTCQDLLNPPQRVYCTQTCTASCFCESGYIRESYEVGSPCIKLDVCYAKRVYRRCGSNEIYRRCTSACPPSCADLLNPPTYRVCTRQCIAGFYCREGYYRSSDGQCVRREECSIL